MEYWTYMDGQWIEYKPMEGCDPSFTESSFRVGAVAYAKTKVEGGTELDAQNHAEIAMFQEQECHKMIALSTGKSTVLGKHHERKNR
jgi:hypothetical protein